MSVLGGESRSGLAASCEGCVSTCAQQQLGALGASGFGGIHERGCPFRRVADVDLHAHVEKELDTRRIPMLGEPVERAPPKRWILSHRICPRIEQGRHDGSTCLRRIEQRREAPVVARVDGGPSFKQEGHDLRAVECSCGMQRTPSGLIGLIRVSALSEDTDHDIPLSKCTRPD
jgi:hypothetical protein